MSGADQNMCAKLHLYDFVRVFNKVQIIAFLHVRVCVCSSW